ncbi:putative zinc metalloprotease NCU04133 [Neurospora crassa]|nr:putative zinc metalloprotease NCU04133 [Neurospora crassa]
MINPISFRPGPVTFWTTLIYLALLIPIVIINEKTPAAPKTAEPFKGVNLTEAWLDLTTITRAYHPYNSKFNEEVRRYLLEKVETILEENGASWVFDGQMTTVKDGKSAAVTVFDDNVSNSTFVMGKSNGTTFTRTDSINNAAYFEGTNILVYIRGKEDDEGEWWEADYAHGMRRNAKGLTLVNAHYDSVSTGFGATDDGMGVVTALQVLKYFTAPGHQPQRGIVVMLNNGEEDWLYGAHALGQHKLNPFIHTFLNLEGAGAGGRAIVFRATDREVMAAYARTSHPFGTVIASDAFGLGFISSGTDYSVLVDAYGQRGIDLAFFKPRARYHTNQDDSRHTSKGSLWHMLSAAIHTTKQFSGDTGNTFIGQRPDKAHGKVANGRSSNGVWFDLFGKSFVLFGLRGMFAWSLTLLIATPLVLVGITWLLRNLDKDYFFTSTVKTKEHPEYEAVPIGGWKGFFRFPFALGVAVFFTISSALLMNKVNPLIVYSSRYSVWVMMVSIFYFSFWMIMRGANFVRPSALHRGYANLWLFVFGWIVLVAVTALEDRRRIAAGYIFVFLESAIFLSCLISFVELLALPRKSSYALQVQEDYDGQEHDHNGYQGFRDSTDEPSLRARAESSASAASPPSSTVAQEPSKSKAPAGTTNGLSTAPSVAAHSSQPQPAPITPIPGRSSGAPSTASRDENESEDDDEPTERTPLVGGNGTNDRGRTTFATTYRRSITALVHGARKMEEDGEPYDHEQEWSGHLPSWAWFFQFLLLGPFMIILAAQTGLMLTDAVYQTGSDGSKLITPYLIIFVFTVLLILPLTPFIHRVTHHIPVFLLVVFIVTLTYNLIAFPFSANNRYKTFFGQYIDVATGDNKVCYTGIEDYVRPVIAELPSASGREVTCGKSLRRGSTISTCCFDGSAVPPKLGSEDDNGLPQDSYADLITINATRSTKRGDSSRTTARIEITADNTKSCFLQFKKPVSELAVENGSGWDDRFGQYPEDGVGLVRLWHREFGKTWVVNAEWKGSETRKEHDENDGTVICMWSDANTPGTIPALDEALQFVPSWAAVTKFSEGLVEGRKVFKIV